MQSEPRHARMTVWALPGSLAATSGIDVSFSSSGYLDVSVHRVPLHTLWIYIWIHGVFPCGFPHSDIRGSLDICSSPRLFAAYHVFRRLSVPRHPPCALSCLTCSKSASQINYQSCFATLFPLPQLYSVTSAAVLPYFFFSILLRICSVLLPLSCGINTVLGCRYT